MADRAQARGGRKIRRRVVEIDREGQFGLFSAPPASSPAEAEAEPPRFVHPDPRTIFLGGAPRRLPASGRLTALDELPNHVFMQ